MSRQERHDRNVSLVAEAIKRWHLQYDPAEDHGPTQPTLSEFIVAVLEKARRL